MVRVLTKAVQACCAALVAALLLAPAAHASGDSCPVPETPGQPPQTVSAPQALGQTFTLSSERIVSAVHPVVGDAMLGNATVHVTETVVAFGELVPGDAL